MALFLFLLVLLPLLVWLLVPVGITGYSLLTAYTLPKHFWAVARDRQRRRNHALEHATVHVLEERAGRPLSLSGLAEKDGFLLVGINNAEEALDAAREALRRLQGGEHRLAIHPRCGTTLVAAQGIAALTVLTFLVLMPRLFFVGVLVALVLAAWLARPVSLVLQRFVTTSTDLDHLRVVRAEVFPPLNPLALLLQQGGRIKICTAEEKRKPRQPPRPTKRYRAY